ncbi:nucleoporin complex subunit 54-domain-containing protein [Mycena haematopus]|nr:nucleoporin complex subunit 54-domain-containing protein [Mycena haematopus]
MSMFGQPQQQQQTSNIFGGGNTQPQQQQAGGIFGASQNTTQPATTSIFGQTNTRPQFGTTNTNTNTGGGLFGASTQAPSTGLFGSQQQPQQQQQQPTSGLFGNSQQPQQQQPASGLFGNPQQQQPQQNQPAGGNIFGNTQPNSGGLFANNNAGGAGGGLFGSRPAGGIAGAPTLPSLTPNPTGGSSLFGGSTTGQQPTPQPSGLFGQPAQNQNQQRPLFGGATSTNNIFGASTANKPAFGSSFGLPQQHSSSRIPSARQRFLPAPCVRQPRALAALAQQQADAQTQFTRLTARIEGIAAAWNATSPQCQFQYFFYNRVDPNQVGLYGRPPNATNDALWAKAVRENPDPTCLVPAIAVGFDDLRQRVDAQGQQAAAHQERLKELKTRIETLSSTQQQNTARLARFAAAQTQLTHRLLALASHLHLLIPALRSSGIRVEEEELRGWLEELREEIGVRGSGGGGGGRLRGKLGELWALGAGHAAAGGEWKVVDEEGLARIAQILSEQQAGLVHLTKILKGDLADINVVLKGGGKKGEEGDGEELWGSRRAR